MAVDADPTSTPAFTAKELSLCFGFVRNATVQLMDCTLCAALRLILSPDSVDQYHCRSGRGQQVFRVYKDAFDGAVNTNTFLTLSKFPV